MLSGNDAELSKYAVKAHNKKYESWQRDSLTVHLYSMQVMHQKLNYIKLNPLATRYYEINENRLIF